MPWAWEREHAFDFYWISSLLPMLVGHSTYHSLIKHRQAAHIHRHTLYTYFYRVIKETMMFMSNFNYAGAESQLKITWSNQAPLPENGCHPPHPSLFTMVWIVARNLVGSRPNTFKSPTGLLCLHSKGSTWFVYEAQICKKLMAIYYAPKL